MDIILGTLNVSKNRKLIDLFKTWQKMIKTMADESRWKKCKVINCRLRWYYYD